MSRFHEASGYNSRDARAYFRPLLPLPCSRCPNLVQPDMEWEVDHLIPVSEGGGHDLANLHPAHKECNRRHGQKVGQAHANAKRKPQQRSYTGSSDVAEL
jgi:5-methylcytosine-specific restriction endonuclease McrA